MCPGWRRCCVSASPELTPAQIMNRITATARHPGGGGVDNYVGAGVIDRWPHSPGMSRPARLPCRTGSNSFRPPGLHRAPPDRRPITIVVLTGTAVALILGIGALARRA